MIAKFYLLVNSNTVITFIFIVMQWKMYMKCIGNIQANIIQTDSNNSMYKTINDHTNSRRVNLYIRLMVMLYR